MLHCALPNTPHITWPTRKQVENLEQLPDDSTSWNDELQESKKARFKCELADVLYPPQFGVFDHCLAQSCSPAFCPVIMLSKLLLGEKQLVITLEEVENLEQELFASTARMIELESHFKEQSRELCRSCTR